MKKISEIYKYNKMFEAEADTIENVQEVDPNILDTTNTIVNNYKDKDKVINKIKDLIGDEKSNIIDLDENINNNILNLNKIINIEVVNNKKKSNINGKLIKKDEYYYLHITKIIGENITTEDETLLEINDVIKIPKSVQIGVGEKVQTDDYEITAYDVNTKTYVKKDNSVQMNITNITNTDENIKTDTAIVFDIKKHLGDNKVVKIKINNNVIEVISNIIEKNNQILCKIRDDEENKKNEKFLNMKVNDNIVFNDIELNKLKSYNIVGDDLKPIKNLNLIITEIK